MEIRTYPKGSQEKLGDHFTVREFDCPCLECERVLISNELIQKLEEIRRLLGGAIRITSGYRCQHYQDDLKRRGYDTAVGPSQHTAGCAADIKAIQEGTTGMALADLAIKAGFHAIGIAPTWIHVDLRVGKERRWTYAK